MKNIKLKQKTFTGYTFMGETEGKFNNSDSLIFLNKDFEAIDKQQLSKSTIGLTGTILIFNDIRIPNIDNIYYIIKCITNITKYNLDNFISSKEEVSSVVKCPKCNSNQIQIVPRKWSLMTGLLTNKVDRVCINCKHKF